MDSYLRVDFLKNCAKIFLDKGCDEDTRAGKIPREDATLVQGIRNPAVTDTTSEPQIGNSLPGTPVKASMSDGNFAVTRVEPWNTFVSHPCFSGVGIFYTLPQHQQ